MKDQDLTTRMLEYSVAIEKQQRALEAQKERLEKQMVAISGKLEEIKKLKERIHRVEPEHLFV